MSATPYSLPPATMVMLGVRDVQKSIPFYRDLLGLKLTQQFGGFAFFDAGKIALILSEDRVSVRNAKPPKGQFASIKTFI